MQTTFTLSAQINFIEKTAKPFMKWAGGKGQLIESLVNLFPAEIQTGEIKKYAEPFMQYKKFPVNINVLNPTGLLQTYVGGHLMGMDYELINYFEKEKKSILGLESLEEVSTYFEQISLMNLKDIIEVKYGFGSIEEDEQIQRYLKGDLSIIQEDEIDEEVKQRNLSWIPNILDYHIMHGKEAIFCVGYSHLFGEFGLLNLLKENGFKITQSDNVGNFSLFNF